MDFVVLPIAIAVIAATVLPLFKRGLWWLRVFDFPRPQIAGLGVGGLLAFTATDEAGQIASGAGAALAIAVVYQFYRIFPYLPIARRQVVRSQDDNPDQEISILVANVLMSNRRAEDLLRIIEDTDPDIIIAMETDQWWAAQLGGIKHSHPHVIEHPLDNTYGMLLFSRLPLQTASLRFITDEQVPSAFVQVVLRSGDVIDLYALHPAPPQPFQDTFERDAELLIVAQEINQSGRPTIVAGDLNDVAWSHTTRLFQRTSGLLDPRVGRGLFSTYNAKIPFFRWPLDHIFHDPGFQLRQIRRLPYFGSDHFPIFGRFAYHPHESFLHDPPSEKAEDQAEVAERIEEVSGS